MRKVLKYLPILAVLCRFRMLNESVNPRIRSKMTPDSELVLIIKVC